jgi:MFS family permease
VVLRLPVLHRGRHRRRVRGHQLGHRRAHPGFGVIAHTAFKRYPKRTVLGLALFIGQAFLYNAVFFTQALALSTFFGVADDVVPAYIIPFAFGNLLGPVLLGRLFDSVGRRPMIARCYVLSGCC